MWQTSFLWQLNEFLFIDGLSLAASIWGQFLEVITIALEYSVLG